MGELKAREAINALEAAQTVEVDSYASERIDEAIKILEEIEDTT